MTDTEPNAELAYRVLDHIDAEPDSWNQARWECGSAACFGGWAVRLGANALISYNSSDGSARVIEGPESLLDRYADDVANEVLGLDSAYTRGLVDDQDWLYDPSHDRETLGRVVEELFGPRPAATP